MQFTVQNRIQNNSYLPFKTDTYKINKSNQSSSENSRKQAKKRL